MSERSPGCFLYPKISSRHHLVCNGWFALRSDKIVTAINLIRWQVDKGRKAQETMKSTLIYYPNILSSRLRIIILHFGAC
jgi:hypothetical protein